MLASFVGDSLRRPASTLAIEALIKRTAAAWRFLSFGVRTFTCTTAAVSGRLFFVLGGCHRAMGRGLQFSSRETAEEQVHIQRWAWATITDPGTTLGQAPQRKRPLIAMGHHVKSGHARATTQHDNISEREGPTMDRDAAGGARNPGGTG